MTSLQRFSIRRSPMPQPSFPRFPNLPPELQLHIWDFAAGKTIDDMYGTQIVTFFELKHGKKSDSKLPNPPGSMRALLLGFLGVEEYERVQKRSSLLRTCRSSRESALVAMRRDIKFTNVRSFHSRKHFPWKRREGALQLLGLLLDEVRGRRESGGDRW